MRAGRRGVFVSIIAVTNGSEKKTKTNFFTASADSFSFSDGRSGRRETICQLCTTCKQQHGKTWRGINIGQAGTEGVVECGLELAMENSTQHHNITTRYRVRRSAEMCTLARRWHVGDVVVGCV
jgi:hypothetical protein